MTTDNEKLTILKLLAGDHDAEFVAQATSIDADTVVRVASHHGYPDKAKLAWAADILERNMADARRDTAVARPAVARPGPADRRVPAPDNPVADPTANLIARGKKAKHSAKIRRAAERAEKAIETLRDLLTADAETRRAAAAAAAEKERARAAAAAERQRLTDEIAELQQRIRALGGTTASSKASPASKAGVEPRAVREWAAANGIEVRPSGKIAGAIVEQYLAAHPAVG